MKETENHNLPPIVNEYIRAVINTMRYRRKVRDDVRRELTDHFEDALKNCENDQQRQERAEHLIEEFGNVKILGKLLRRAKKRCRPLWRTVIVRIFQVLGILILWQIFYTVWLCFTPLRIHVDYIQEATNLTRSAQDEDMNAAVLYQQAFVEYQEPPKVIKRERITDFMMMDPAVPDYGMTDPEMNAIREEPKYIEKEVSLTDVLREAEMIQYLDPVHRDRLEQWIRNNEKTIGLLRAASSRPLCWWHRKSESGDAIGILLPEVTHIRNMYELLCWRARIYADQGEYPSAFDTLLTCYRIGMHLKGPRTLIEQLVGFRIQTQACEMSRLILDQYKVPASVLKEYQEKLSALKEKDHFVADFHCEKFFYKDFIQRFYSDNGRGSGRILPMQVLKKGGAYGFGPLNEFSDDFRNRSVQFALAVGSSWVTADRKDMENEFERIYWAVQEYAYKTPWQLHQEHVDLDFGLDDYSSVRQLRYWPVYMLVPGVRRIMIYASCNQVETEAVITILALERYHQEQGTYPDSLSGLIDGDYLTAIPEDPFSDAPLVYRKTEGGFTLYSVGENFTDDGGKIWRNDDGQFQMWTAKEGDAVFWPVPEKIVPGTANAK